jgi:peptidoglycan/LPS O-acetylase OafA/YrhL
VHRGERPERPFLRSALGVTLLGFLAVGALLLVVEHRSHIFVGDWFLWLLPLACVVMHAFHGGHSGHGHRHDRTGRPGEGNGA